MKSFRTRLALLSALISAVVIVVLAVAGTLLTRRLLMQSLDMQLAVPLDRISRDLHPRTDLERVRSNAEIVHGNDIAEGKLLMMMRHDREGEILYRAPEDDWLDALAPELWKRDAPFDAPARRPPFEPHEPGEFAGEPGMFPPPHPPPFDRPLPGGERDRGGGKGKKGKHPPPIQFDGGPPPVEYHIATVGEKEWRIGVLRDRGYTVLMARDLSEFHGEMAKVFRLLAIGTPVCLILIGAGGWFVGHRALQPVNLITETANRISARDLTERIPESPGEYEEFANLVSVLNRMMSRLERGFSHATRFSADVSHELKTPLTVMMAELSSALKKTQPGTEEHRALQSIEQECHRLKSITGSLMLLSQADSGRLETRKASFSLSNEIEDLAEDAEILCEKAKLNLECAIEPDVDIVSDHDLLHQALLNLVSNAVKYNQTGGWVKMELNRDPETGEAVFRIANSGPGIPEEEREHIFDRFYRVDKSRGRSVDGFGLGLNLAMEMIAVVGGKLALIEAEGEETAFEVRLPVG